MISLVRIERQASAVMIEGTYFDNMTPLERIEMIRPSLTKKQLKIADYLTEHFDTAAFSTLAEFSTTCSISETSILRFASALGYSGYSDMQRAFQDFMRSRISMSKRLGMVTNLGTDSASIMHMIMQKGIEGLQRTMVSINEAHFQAAVDLLANANRVFMFGSRSSFSLVQFFALELRWIRDNVFALNTQSSEFDALAGLQKDDVFLSVSMPRYLRSTTDAMSFVSRAGIPTIAITDSLTSPLIPYTTVPIIVDNEIFSYCDNTVPILATITALLNAIGAATYPRSREVLARNEKTWEHFNLYLR